MLKPPCRIGPMRSAPWLFSRAFLPIWSCSVWGLPCLPRYRGSGALLPHLFTLTRSCWAVCSLWHWPSTGLDARVPDVIRHTALRSSDFPPPVPLLALGFRQRPPGPPASSKCTGKAGIRDKGTGIRDEGTSRLRADASNAYPQAVIAEGVVRPTAGGPIQWIHSATERNKRDFLENAGAGARERYDSPQCAACVDGGIERGGERGAGRGSRRAVFARLGSDERAGHNRKGQLLSGKGQEGGC